MPNQPFIMRLHFYLPGGQGLHSLESGAHHVAYAGSKEKAELMIDGLMAESNARTTLKSAAIHARYAGEREGSMGYFGSMADDPKAAQESILNAKGPVWRLINSVGESDAIAMGGDLTTKAGWEKASEVVVPQMIEKLGLDPAKTQWIAAAHRHQKHEKNPHIHLLIWEEGEPTRKTGEWTDAERKSIRKDWITELYRPERERLGREKSEARTEARATVIDLVSRRDERQGYHRELDQHLRELGTMLPGHGRLAYGFMPGEVKTKTEEIIRWMWKHDPGLKAQHEKYVKSAEELGMAYWHKDPKKTQDSPARQAAMDRIHQNAEKDLIQRLAAPVLKAAKATAHEPKGQRPNVVRGTRLAHVMKSIMHRAEQDARQTEHWLEEAQYRARQAEAAIARSTGQELAQ